MDNKAIKKLEADLWESADLLRAGSKLTSQQYCIYDLLFSENLSKADIQSIKKMSVDLLAKIKERIATMDHWTDKEETRAAVEIVIRNTLWNEIPESMFERLETYQQKIYEYVYSHYHEAA